MKIISISGLDGSGKSTQINMLKKHFEDQGKKVFYFHAVSFSFPQAAKAFWKKHCILCKLFGKCKTKPALEKSSSGVATGEKPGVTKSSWLGIFLRKVALAIDIIRFKRLKKKLTDQNVDFLLTDRYFYDTIVNIAYLERKNTPCKLEKYLPPADIAFYLKIEPEAIMARDRAPEQGLTYLKDKKKLYNMYANLWNLRIIDGSKTKQDIFANIISLL